ncbi:hypothetical protein Vretimale_11033 [Volvox reticuliferus]|uniref:Uncharacterized protein n=1 Tax=Volvox reticuliferus TaxID=1737510 RepID=A0A8J4LS04_9CHLO|nr:hypothetical protein Vretifemale_12800 [Volvox reticuliferus]GIM06836.1 hypothetical protein Vretimale_11033 [Volvox reticuliferus]
MKRFALALLVCTVLAFPRLEARDVPRINHATTGHEGKVNRDERGNGGATPPRDCVDGSSDCIRNHRGHATIRPKQILIYHSRSSHNSINSSSDGRSSSNSRQRQPLHPRGGSGLGSGAAKTLRGNGVGGSDAQGQLRPPYDSGADGDDLRQRKSAATATYRQPGYNHRRQVLNKFAYPQYSQYAPELPSGAPPPQSAPPPAPTPTSLSALTGPSVGETSPPALSPPPPPLSPLPPSYPGSLSPRPPGAPVPQTAVLGQVSPRPSYANQWTTASGPPAAVGHSSGIAAPNGPTGLHSSVLPSPLPPSQQRSTVASLADPPLLESPVLPPPLPPPYYLSVRRRGMAKFDAILAATAGAVGAILLLMFVFVMLRIRKRLRSGSPHNSAFCVPEAARIRVGGGGAATAAAVARPFKGVAFDPEVATDAEMSPLRFTGGGGAAAAVPMPTGKKEFGSAVKPRSIVRGGGVSGVTGILSSKKLGGSTGGAVVAGGGGGGAAGVNLDMCHNLLYDMYDIDNSPDVGRRGVPPALQRHMAAQSSGGGGGGGGAVRIPMGHDTERVVRRLTVDMALTSPHGYSAAARTVASRTHGSGGDVGPMGQCSGDTTARRGSLDQNSLSPNDQHTKGRKAIAKSRTTAAAAAAAQTGRRTTADDDDAYAVLVVGRHRRESSFVKDADDTAVNASDSDGEQHGPPGDGRGYGLTPWCSISATSDAEAAVRFASTRHDVMRHTGNVHGRGVSDSGSGRQLDSCNGGSGGGSAPARDTGPGHIIGTRARPGVSDGGAVAGYRTTVASHGPARGASSYASAPPVGSGGAAAAIVPTTYRLKRPPRTSSGGSGSIAAVGMATARSTAQSAAASLLRRPSTTAPEVCRRAVRHTLDSAAAAAVSAPTPAASSSPAAATGRRRYHVSGSISGSDVDNATNTAADTGASDDDNECAGDGDGGSGTNRAGEVAHAALLRRLPIRKSGRASGRQVLDPAPEAAAAASVTSSKPSPRAAFTDNPTSRSISLLAAAAAAASSVNGCDRGRGRKPGGSELNAATLGSVSYIDSSPRMLSAREKPPPQRHRLWRSSNRSEPTEQAVMVIDVKETRAPTAHAGLRSGNVIASRDKKDGDGGSSDDSNDVEVEAAQQPSTSAGRREQQPLPPPPQQQQQQPRFRRPPR